jgi:CDP-glycerol glycerophosphotransferase
MSLEQKNGFKLNLININPTSESAYESDIQIISRKVTKQDLVLYFGREEFSDNSKYLFIHASDRSNGHRHVWCTYNKYLIQELRGYGLEAFDLGANVNKTIQLLLRAKIAVFTVNPAESLKSRVFLATLAGARKMQLWHGIGVKRMEMQNVEHKNFLDLPTVARMRWSAEIDYILSPSEYFDRHWQETFGVEKVIRAGYPRNEVLLRDAVKLELVNTPADLISDSAKKKLLIVPTWGTVGDRHWSKSIPSLYQVALKNDVEIYVKPHPYEAALSDKHLAAGSSLTILPASTDIYPFLNRFNCMITDHSSMAFDAFLIDMDMILIEPNDKRFYMTEILERKIGPTIGNLGELDKLPSLLEESKLCSENRDWMAKKYFETPPLDANTTINDFAEQLALGTA